MAGETSRSASSPPRWLADEMLGRLARYLRFLGHDTAYVQGRSDDELVDLARAERRTLLTRDRELSARASPSLLLESPELSDQLRAVRSAFPEAGWAVTFARCTLCNSPLAVWPPPTGGEWPSEVPRDLVEQGLQVFECPSCHQRYWEGSHTRRIRRQLEMWFAGEPR